MKLRLADNFNTSNMDPATIALVAGALNNSTSSDTTSESGEETSTLDPNTFNVISQTIAGIQGLQSLANREEERRVRQLIDSLKAQFDFGRIKDLSELSLLNYAMAFDIELKRLNAEKAPINTIQGRIDERYIQAFKILNAAIDTEAKLRGYKRVGVVGTPASQYFLKVEDVVNDLLPGSSAGVPSGSSLIPGVPSMAGVSNIAVLALVGALGYMLLKK